MYQPISISEKGIRGEFCPYCKAPTIRVPASSISTYIPLESNDIVFQCVEHPQHFIAWNRDDIHQQGTLADPYLRACRYRVALELEHLIAQFSDSHFARECVVRYINYKMKNGHSSYLNLQLLAEKDCFAILQILNKTDWKRLIPVSYNDEFAQQIRPAHHYFNQFLSLKSMIEQSVIVELYNNLEIEMPIGTFVDRTFELIDFFTSCGDQFLRVVPAQCAVCYANSNSPGFLMIGNRSWNYTSFIFHFRNNRLMDLHDCASMVHPCQHLPLGNKYSFQRGRIIDSASLYN